MNIDLNQKIIDHICDYTKFRYDGDCFVLYLPYNYDTIGADIKIKLKIKSKIISINEDNSIFASIFIDGFEDNKIKSFRNLSDYAVSLKEKEISLHYHIKYELDCFLKNIFN